MEITSQEMKFLKRAIVIASEGIIEGSGPFGAVISKDGVLISEAANRVVLDADPTAHAEILAIRKASGILGSHDLSGCSLYSSCEPCPMCLAAIYWAGIKNVVFASDRKDAAEAGFDDENIYNEISMESGKRSIQFIQIEDPAANEVFKKWIEFEDKITY